MSCDDVKEYRRRVADLEAEVRRLRALVALWGEHPAMTLEAAEAEVERAVSS